MLLLQGYAKFFIQKLLRKQFKGLAASLDTRDAKEKEQKEDSQFHFFRKYSSGNVLSSAKKYSGGKGMQNMKSKAVQDRIESSVLGEIYY